ncbi:uncharacterized protein LOC112559335 [Pomacea canaliculata]|uniref:uncharacterized protein LOC112559335 n=1 Tax=Pomacea canaliculata TaxID=400727 RepID=UPI000D73E89E|nr:uncharacterized protein LOC112559335 [Pomacea canaliculata]
MFTITFTLLVATTLHVLVAPSTACYRECSSAFNQKILELVPVTDTAIIREKSCEAMGQQIVCLKTRLGTPGACDDPSTQTVNSILTFIEPDYESSCRNATANTTGQSLSPQQLVLKCGQMGKECYDDFNNTFTPAVTKLNVTALCASLDQYTLCAERMMTDCGQYMAGPITSIRSLQRKYSAMCSTANNVGGEVMSDCVNQTMQCYLNFNSSFVPAASLHSLTGICGSIEDYSKCLNGVHNITACQHFTNQALTGLATMQRQYTVVCGADRGETSQKCMVEFQSCYRTFNNTFLSALQTPGGASLVCKSVEDYGQCVDRVEPACSQQKVEVVRTAKLLRQMYSAQCDKKLQQLMACLPLRVCLNTFVGGSFLMTSPSPLCSRFSTFFPCVESSLQLCNIPHHETGVDFPALGKLTGSFCQNLLGNTRLSMCPEFHTCTENIIASRSLIDFSVVFNGTTWCDYMDMALGCVVKAVSGELMGNCMLSNDQQIKSHLTTLQKSKLDVCENKVSPALSGSSGANNNAHGGEEHARLDSASRAAGYTSAAVKMAAMATLISFFVQRLL